MRQAMRRAIGIGGATFVAVGAALVLTLPASAHEASATPGCASDGHATIHIATLKDYDTNTPTPKPNSVTVTEGTAVIFATDPFGKTYDKTVTLDGTKVHNLIVHFKAWDDPTGSKGWTVDIPVTTTVCTSEHPSSTTNPPTTTTVPPTHTTTKPPTTTIAPETTTAAVVALHRRERHVPAADRRRAGCRRWWNPALAAVGRTPPPYQRLT
jgi:hypothetical protein